MHNLKKHNRFIYSVCLYFGVFLILEHIHWFSIETDDIKEYLIILWSVQACISVLAITMIAITMGYNETKIYGRSVREIVFHRKLDKIDINARLLKCIEIFSSLSIMGINIFFIYKISKVNSNYIFLILLLVLIGYCLYIYIVDKRNVKVLDNNKGWIVVLFVFVKELTKIENEYVIALMLVILLVEIVFTRNCITYYDRILTAIIFIPMCGFFVVEKMIISTMAIGVVSVLNIVFLIYYSVEYILDYEKFKEHYRKEIKTMCVENIKKENEEISND